MSVPDGRHDILVSETVVSASDLQYGTWGSTQGVAEVAVVAWVSEGTLIGDGVFLVEANDTATPTELYAHVLSVDPSGSKFYGVFQPGAGFVTLGVNASDGTAVAYSIRVVKYL